MGVLSGKSKFARNAIEEEDALASSLRSNGKRIIPLNRGDTTAFFPTPKHIVDAYISAIKRGMTSYSRAEGIPELCDAISARYKRVYNVNVDPDSIIVTAGVSEALSFINGSLIDKGERAVLFKPYYPPYVSNLLLNLGDPLYGYYSEDNEWDIDIDHISKQLKRVPASRRPKYMMLTNPNNPTGTVLSKKTLERIASLANEHGIFLISDEIYDEIVYNGAKFTSVAKVCKGMPHAILNGMSKSYNSTGARVGYAIFPERDASSREIAEKMKDFARVRISSNTPAQYAFAEALKASATHAREIRKMVKAIAERTNHAVDKLGENPYISVTRPNGAYYIFARIKSRTLKFKDDKEFVDSLLTKTGVQLAPGYGFGAPGHFRMVALAPKGILGYAADRINDFCKANAR